MCSVHGRKKLEFAPALQPEPVRSENPRQESSSAENAKEQSFVTDKMANQSFKELQDLIDTLEQDFIQLESEPENKELFDLDTS